MDKFENPYNEMEVMLLILLAASKLKRKVGFNELWNLVYVDNNISYFDYCICLDKLEKNKQMSRYEDNMYEITEDGRRNCAILEDMIPVKIKPLIEKSAEEQRAIDMREANIKTEYLKRPNGEYMVTLGLDDGVDCVFRLQLIAPNEENAEKMKTMFRENPEDIFADILESLFRTRKSRKSEQR